MQSRLPQACFLCGARVIGQMLCAGCAADLPALSGGCCPQCALPTPKGEICGACLNHPPAYDRTLAAFAYDFPLDVLVQQCKYAQVTALTEFFAEQMARRIGKTDPGIDYLLPMPLHPERLAQRGFNQAAEIARRLSPRLGIPWLPDACRRLRNTPSQAGLDLKTRQRNLRGAFACVIDLRGKRVALIDDVMTSGSSLDELARTARKAGATEIHAWVLARTL
jgi:ComF family protein